MGRKVQPARSTANAARALQLIETTPIAWHRGRKEVASPCDNVVNEARTILSKLAPANLDKLSEQVTALEVNDVPTLIALVSLMFERAVQESSFCVHFLREPIREVRRARP